MAAYYHTMPRPEMKEKPGSSPSKVYLQVIYQQPDRGAYCITTLCSKKADILYQWSKDEWILKIKEVSSRYISNYSSGPQHCRKMDLLLSSWTELSSSNSLLSQKKNIFGSFLLLYFHSFTYTTNKRKCLLKFKNFVFNRY